MWYVYLLECSDTSFYTGVTTCIERRVRQHNGDIKGGAKYTRSRRPVMLIRSWEVKDRSEALKKERFIKRLSRQQKLLLKNPSIGPFD